MHRTVSLQRRAPRPARRWTRQGPLLALELSCGLGALAGGVAFILRPDGSILHMPTSYLAGSPFSDYRVPGLLLAGVVGAGMLGAALLEVRGRPYARASGMVSGAALLIFELVEFAIIGFNPMQALFAALGACSLALAGRR